MMKRLYLLRHAKSSWAQPGLSDFDRSLNQRGHKQMAMLSDWFGKKDVPKPEKVLYSPSERTTETLSRLRASLSGPEEQSWEELYNGSVQNYLDALGEQSANCLMLIGHNPACDELSRYLTAPSSPAAQQLMLRHFGTATLAILEFDGNEWSDLSAACCQLVDYIRPKDLRNVKS